MLLRWFRLAHLARSPHLLLSGAGLATRLSALVPSFVGDSVHNGTGSVLLDDSCGFRFQLPG